MAHRPICARSNIFSLSKFSSVRTPHIGLSGALSENILRASEWVGRVTALTKHLMEGLFPPAVAGYHLPFTLWISSTATVVMAPQHLEGSQKVA